MIEAIIGAVWPYLLGALALVAGWITARQTGKSAGKKEVELKQTEEALEAIRRSNANREEVGRMDDNAQLTEFDRLRTTRRKKEHR